jgi:regulator of sirC expression with transglutaminase-like and TPR domain
LLYRQLILFIALGLSLPAHAATRTWEFDLQTPGTYEVHVQHRIGDASVPLGSEASYTFQTPETTLQRELPFYLKEYPHPIVVLVADIASPQKAKVVISGLPKPLLQQTRVYVIDGNTRYPYEWFDPGKSVDLEAAWQIRHILKQPEQTIDLARAKLTIDKLIDPAVDIEANLKVINTMVAEINAMAGFNASGRTKLRMLRHYLYESGEWNNYSPYQYDLDDPKANKIQSVLLPTYLATKKGNCVTMPFLFIILGQRLGLDMTASTAPQHFLAKYKDDVTGNWYNLETTSGGYPMPEIGYREQMPLTDQAIANGIYLQPLTRKQTVAVMARALIQHYMARREYEQVITISDLILEYYPKDAEVMVNKSSAYGGLMNEYYSEDQPAPNRVTERYISYLQYLSRNNREWYAKAEALGWRLRTKEDDEKYTQIINEAKQQKTMNLN